MSVSIGGARESWSNPTEENAVRIPAADSRLSAPTVVLFLEGVSVTALRSAVSALLSAGRSVFVFAR
jgi:hypothetical protein